MLPFHCAASGRSEKILRAKGDLSWLKMTRSYTGWCTLFKILPKWHSEISSKNLCSLGKSPCCYHPPCFSLFGRALVLLYTCITILFMIFWSWHMWQLATLFNWDTKSLFSLCLHSCVYTDVWLAMMKWLCLVHFRAGVARQEQSLEERCQ